MRFTTRAPSLALGPADIENLGCPTHNVKSPLHTVPETSVNEFNILSNFQSTIKICMHLFCFFTRSRYEDVPNETEPCDGHWKARNCSAHYGIVFDENFRYFCSLLLHQSFEIYKDCRAISLFHWASSLAKAQLPIIVIITSDRGGGATLVRLCLARMLLVCWASDLLQHLQHEKSLPQRAPHLLSGGQQGVLSTGEIRDARRQHLHSRNRVDLYRLQKIQWKLKKKKMKLE